MEFARQRSLVFPLLLSPITVGKNCVHLCVCVCVRACRMGQFRTQDDQNFASEDGQCRVGSHYEQQYRDIAISDHRCQKLFVKARSPCWWFSGSFKPCALLFCLACSLVVSPAYFSTSLIHTQHHTRCLVTLQGADSALLFAQNYNPNCRVMSFCCCQDIYGCRKFLYKFWG